mmetsp:Transcript_12904/g.30203  ORF Transcript_12904/g.30203 Transcript_12904/m.30203 type:complete len:252 (-) Transcript_12904:60-815(-)
MAEGAAGDEETQRDPVLESKIVALREFLASTQDDANDPQLVAPEELRAIISEIARTGTGDAYPWKLLRQLLCLEVGRCLREFWKAKPDLQLPENESFEDAAVAPLQLCLRDPFREGAPFTLQRICELLSQPLPNEFPQEEDLKEPRRKFPYYRSTRRYLYALQRVIFITMTESYSQLGTGGPQAPVNGFHSSNSAANGAANGDMPCDDDGSLKRKRIAASGSPGEAVDSAAAEEGEPVCKTLAQAPPDEDL